MDLSGTHTLLYDDLFNVNGDTTGYDWQEAYWRPYGTTGWGGRHQALKLGATTRPGTR